MKIAVKVDTLKNNEVIKNLLKRFDGTLILLTSDDRYLGTSSETESLTSYFDLTPQQVIFMAGNKSIKYLKALQVDVYVTKSSEEVRDCIINDVKTMLIE